MRALARIPRGDWEADARRLRADTSDDVVLEAAFALERAGIVDGGHIARRQNSGHAARVALATQVRAPLDARRH